MLRFTVRLIPLLVLLIGFSRVAKADSLTITFIDSSGTVFGTGQFTTDGLCTSCSPGSGLLTWLVGIGPDTGPNAFDIVDDGPATASITYDRLTNTFSSVATFNSENNDFFVVLSNNTWLLSTTSGGSFSGTYVVTSTSVPEPPMAALSMLAIVLAGLLARRHA